MKASDYVLTEADRVKDLRTIDDDEQVIIRLPDGNIVAREWYGDHSSDGWKVYRDPRPLPRIVVAKEKTLEEKVAIFLVHDADFYECDNCPNCGAELFDEVDHVGGLQCMDGGMYCNCPHYGYCNECDYDTRTAGLLPPIDPEGFAKWFASRTAEKGGA